MMLLITFVVFAVVAVAISLVGMKLWVQPKEAIERVTGSGYQQEESVVHPSLVFRDLMNRLGDVMPTSPKDVTAMQ